MELNVRVDIEEVEKQLYRAERREVPKATAWAINRTLNTARSRSAKTISRETGIQQKKFAKQPPKGRMLIKRATWENLQGELHALPYAPNLIEYVSKGSRKPGAFRKKSGVQARAWGSKKTYPGTFVGQGQNSGKALVFRRTSGDRYPIKAIYGPSVPQTFMNRIVQRVLDAVANYQFPRQFSRELSRRLGRLNNR
ncbi:MAG: phage tail protein [Thiohalorhabdus sp.]